MISGEMECFPWSTKGAQTTKPRAERSAALGHGTVTAKSPERAQQGAAPTSLRPFRALTKAHAQPRAALRSALGYIVCALSVLDQEHSLSPKVIAFPFSKVALSNYSFARLTRRYSVMLLAVEFGPMRNSVGRSFPDSAKLNLKVSPFNS